MLDQRCASKRPGGGMDIVSSERARWLCSGDASSSGFASSNNSASERSRETAGWVDGQHRSNPGTRWLSGKISNYSAKRRGMGITRKRTSCNAARISADYGNNSGTDIFSTIMQHGSTANFVADEPNRTQKSSGSRRFIASNGTRVDAPPHLSPTYWGVERGTQRCG